MELILLVVAIVVAVVWLFFPFTVNSRLNSIIEEIEKMNEKLDGLIKK